MILYDYVLSASCYKVRLMAALLKVPLKLKAVNFYPEREHKSEEYLSLNSSGTLPILVADGLTLTDTPEILAHLAQSYDPSWLGQETETLTQEWLHFSGDLNKSLGMARLHDVLSYAADIDALRDAGILQLRHLEARLTDQRFDGQTFLTGDMPTIADIACFPNVALAPDGGVSLDSYPSIRLWTRAIRAMPGFIEMPGIHRLHEMSPTPETIK